MTHTMFVPVDYDAMVSDVIGIAKVPLSSGDSSDAIFLYDYDDDPQQGLVYDLAISIAVRNKLIAAGADGAIMWGSIIRIERNFRDHVFGCDVEFRSRDEAMLFKLAQGGEA